MIIIPIIPVTSALLSFFLGGGGVDKGFNFYLSDVKTVDVTVLRRRLHSPTI